jgi:glyoxylase-like metal-dependent hydrolase (beta-lactamase superfamily II)
MATEVAPGVWRLGTELINWYLVVDDGKVTVVDTAVPGYWPQFDEALEQIGRSRDDVAAVLLTHGDLDHVGVAERLRTELGVPVHLNPADLPLARDHKRKKTDGPFYSVFLHPTGRRFVREFIKTNSLRTPKLRESEPLTGDETLDVPGRPRVIATPGHTNGHVVFHFPSHGVVFTGDAMCSLDPIYGHTGPRPMPDAMNTSGEGVRRSFEKIEGLDAQHLLFGHGEPWSGGAREGVALARRAG